MIAKFVFFLSMSLSLAIAVPVDPYEHKYLAAPAAVAYHTAPAISYAAPALTYAAPAKLLAPAPTLTKVLAPAPALVKTVEPEPYDPNPQYSFSYGVSDHHTGDSKSQEETLVDGVVHGSYSLTEADGTVRKVTYTADKVHGFNAVVEKSGTPEEKPTVALTKVAYAAPAVTKVAYAAPAYTKVAYAAAAAPAYTAKFAYAAPALAKVAYAAPASYYHH